MVGQKSNKEGKKFTTIKVSIEAYQEIIKRAVQGQTITGTVDQIMGVK